MRTPEVKEIFHFFKLTTMPDEKFWGSVIVNSPFREKWLNINTKYPHYASHVVTLAQFTVVTDNTIIYTHWSPNAWHPSVLTKRFLPTLLSTPHLFARKFDSASNAEVVPNLKAELEKRSSSQLPVDSEDLHYWDTLLRFRGFE